MGDRTAHRLRYHPTARFFGKAPGASLGLNNYITDYPEWQLRYSLEDLFHLNHPQQYLNRSEFPIDFPVWHNPDAAAAGSDAVVEAALDWIENLVYGHSLTIESMYYVPNIDTVNITATIENPNLHPVSSQVYIESFDNVFIDSVNLNPQRINSSSANWTGKFLPPLEEHSFKLSISAFDSLLNEKFTTNNVAQFTTTGPLVIDSYEILQITKLLFGYRVYFNLSIKNNGVNGTAGNVMVEISSSDSTVYSMTHARQTYGRIDAGQTISSPIPFVIRTTNQPANDTLICKVIIYDYGYSFWQDSTDVVVGTKVSEIPVPLTCKLYQNYPNPFNPTTIIEFDLPKTGEVSLKIFNILGEEVATLVSDRLSAGSYWYEWSRPAGIASGVYLYRLQAGDYSETRKMVLMR
jgi:hypothetical protein